MRAKEEEAAEDERVITNSMDMNLSKLWEIMRTGKPGMLQSMGSQRVRHDLVIGQQQQTTKLTVIQQYRTNIVTSVEF